MEILESRKRNLLFLYSRFTTIRVELGEMKGVEIWFMWKRILSEYVANNFEKVIFVRL